MTDAELESTGSGAEAQYLETIALLQDEIARLEGELLAQHAVERPSHAEEHDEAEASREEGPVHEQLRAELAARDETINLLLDQLRLVEDAERATRAEWEELAGWLAEVEDRVDRRDLQAADGDEQRLTELRRETDELRATITRQQSAWERARRDLQRENQRLQSLLAEQAANHASESSAGSAELATLTLLRSENDSLQERCQELQADRDQQVQALTEQLDAVRRELVEARDRKAAVEDERVRERREYEVAIASLRSQSARASIHAAERGEAASARGPHDSAALEADVRIHVFRQHLREIHNQEEENKNRSRLGARLSRLWGRTAPGGSKVPSAGMRS